MRGSLTAFALVLAAVGIFVRQRGRAIGGSEVFLLWLGCALSFAFAFAFLAYHHEAISAALRLSPYLWDAVLYVIAFAIPSGLALAYAWRRRARS